MAPKNDEPGASNSLVDLSFLKKDDGNKEMLRQIAMGGGAGWLTGFISMKIGKVAATAVGGAMIILQIANHKGYIKINWSRVNHDVEKVKTKLKEEATGKKADWADKVMHIVQHSSYRTISFVAGFLIGTASS